MVDEEAVKKVEAYFKRAEKMTRDVGAQATLAETMVRVEQYNNTKGRTDVKKI